LVTLLRSATAANSLSALSFIKVFGAWDELPPAAANLAEPSVNVNRFHTVSCMNESS
jgi:hypothetical protein